MGTRIRSLQQTAGVNCQTQLFVSQSHMTQAGNAFLQPSAFLTFIPLFPPSSVFPDTFYLLMILLMREGSHMSGFRLICDDSYIMLPFFYSHQVLTFIGFISSNVSLSWQLM